MKAETLIIRVDNCANWKVKLLSFFVGVINFMPNIKDKRKNVFITVQFKVDTE